MAEQPTEREWLEGLRYEDKFPPPENQDEQERDWQRDESPVTGSTCGVCGDSATRSVLVSRPSRYVVHRCDDHWTAAPYHAESALTTEQQARREDREIVRATFAILNGTDCSDSVARARARLKLRPLLSDTEGERDGPSAGPVPEMLIRLAVREFDSFGVYGSTEEELLLGVDFGGVVPRPYLGRVSAPGRTPGATRVEALCEIIEVDGVRVARREAG